jgi:hypothetical protein
LYALLLSPTCYKSHPCHPQLDHPIINIWWRMELTKPLITSSPLYCYKEERVKYSLLYLYSSTVGTEQVSQPIQAKLNFHCIKFLTETYCSKAITVKHKHHTAMQSGI